MAADGGGKGGRAALSARHAGRGQVVLLGGGRVDDGAPGPVWVQVAMAGKDTRAASHPVSGRLAPGQRDRTLRRLQPPLRRRPPGAAVCAGGAGGEDGQRPAAGADGRAKGGGGGGDGAGARQGGVTSGGEGKPAGLAGSAGQGAEEGADSSRQDSQVRRAATARGG